MFKALTSNSFDVLWKKALVCAPRLVPSQVLKWTDPRGPYPIIVQLSSRGDYKIPCYIFIKHNLTHEEAAKLPVVIDFHGGGFFLGSCLEQAPFCSKLARELAAVVITVDYRMGPIDKFPAAIEDAEDILRAVLQPESSAGVELRAAVKLRILEDYAAARSEVNQANDLLAQHQPSSSQESTSAIPIPQAQSDPPHIALDTSRLSISGFSSGGNLALNLALSINEPVWPSLLAELNHTHPVPLLLFYPSFDARQLPSERTMPVAHASVSKGFWSGVSDLLAPTYLPRDQAGHLRASPGLAEVSSIHATARMLLVLPGNDSLAEQSETWVAKLQADGTRTKDLRIERYPMMKHGWTQFPDGWMSDEERKTKAEIFDKTVVFMRKTWSEDTTVVPGSTTQ